MVYIYTHRYAIYTHRFGIIDTALIDMLIYTKPRSFRPNLSHKVLLSPKCHKIRRKLRVWILYGNSGPFESPFDHSSGKIGDLDELEDKSLSFHILDGENEFHFLIVSLFMLYFMFNIIDEFSDKSLSFHILEDENEFHFC